MECFECLDAFGETKAVLAAVSLLVVPIAALSVVLDAGSGYISYTDLLWLCLLATLVCFRFLALSLAHSSKDTVNYCSS